MLNFIKNLFKKKEPEIEKIEPENLIKWLSSKSRFIRAESEVKINNINEKLTEEIKKAKENLEKLEKAELRNPNIPEKIKQVMQGNRISYIKSVTGFIENIKKEKEPKEIINYQIEFFNNLKNLEKSTGKPYTVLKEFFANEVTDIAVNIRNTGNLINSLKEAVEESGISKIEELKEEIAELNNTIGRKESLLEKTENKKNKIEELKKTIENLNKSKKETLDSDKYKELLEQIEKKEKLILEISEYKNKIIQPFSVLNKAIKKFSKIALDNIKIIESYLSEPLKTLLKDKELIILDILLKIEKNLKINKLGIEEKKKAKSLLEIEKLNKRYLEEFIEKYTGLNKELEKTTQEIKDSLTKNKLKEIKKELKDSEEKINKNTEKIEKITSEINNINIEKQKKELEEKINQKLNLKIEIN